MASFHLVHFLAAALALSGHATADTAANNTANAQQWNSEYNPVCSEIESKISSGSKLVWPYNAVTFASDIYHWYFSSSQTPTCVVEVGSKKDLSTVMQIVGDTRTPFAVMSGGHASNPGFSSTQGVHINLKRLNHVILSADSQTVDVGFGQGWVDVYKALDNTGYNVVGGRVPGPGVGGFTLGGGYSWKTNQYGLTCDNIISYELVLPNGTMTTVTANQYPDLFWALKGGMNRFGVVTSAVMKVHPQPPTVYAGLALYTTSQISALLSATSQFFYDNTDPKAAVITTLEGNPLGTSAIALFFYDGPTKPESFSLFDNITSTVSTVRPQSFNSFINSIPAPFASLRNPRGAFTSFSTSEISQAFVDAVQAEVDAVGQEMVYHSGTAASFDVEPFTDFGKHATDSAFPHSKSPLPLNLYFAWALPSEDEWWYARMKTAVENIKAVARAEGIYVDADTHPAYPNYALFDEPADELYGPRNAARLRTLRDRYDPERVMDLAGGFVL